MPNLAKNRRIRRSVHKASIQSLPPLLRHPHGDMPKRLLGLTGNHDGITRHVAGLSRIKLQLQPAAQQSGCS